MNVIFLKNYDVFFFKNTLFLIMPNGIVKIKLDNYIRYLTFTVTKSSLQINDTSVNKCYSTLVDDVHKKILNKLSEVNFIFKQKLMLFGIGFRCWTYKDSDKFNQIIFKIGFSRDLCVKIPRMIKVTPLKSTLILCKSLDKAKLNQFAAYLRSLKISDIYKGKGIRYVHEVIVLKTGKNN
jgi:large subunit ribosomal protein L6